MKRTDVEALRAIAILLVVAFHAGVSGITGGFIGVDVFYVLSGYLITGLLVAEIQRAGRLSLLQFYARRARRLLPAASLMLLVTLGAASVVFAPQELDFAARGARSSAVYISNLFFAQNARDYFAPQVTSNPLLHTWSLSVEEQFYVFWPIIIVLSMRWRRSVKALALWLALLILLSLAASVWLTRTQPVFAFYSLLTRAWEFGFGALAVLIPRGRLMLPRAAWLAAGWLGIALIAASALTIAPATPFPGWAAVVPVLGTLCVLIACAEMPEQGVGVLLRARWLQWVGGLSYTWYLWHWPFLVVAAALIPGLGLAGKLAAVAGALCVALLTHRYFENPIRFNPTLMARPIASIVGAAAIAAVCVIAASACIRFAERLGRQPEMQASTFAAHDISTLPRNRCVSLDGNPALVTCSFGNASSAATIVVFGDSHAIPWFEPLHAIAVKRNWKLVTVLKPGCAAAKFSIEPTPALVEECLHWRAAALESIVAMRPNLVFLGSATNRLMRYADANKHASAAHVDAVGKGTRSTLEALSNAGLRVLFVRDNPEFNFSVPTCLARAARHAWYPSSSCEMPRGAVLDDAVFEAEAAAAHAVPNVTYVDLTPVFCSPTRCTGMRGGLIMYRDRDHLDAKFAASLASVIEPYLLGALDAQQRP